MFDIDAPVGGFLPDLPLGAGVDTVTTRHLLTMTMTMTSGIDLGWSETLMTDWPDLAAEFLGRPTTGRVFQYSNASTYTAMRALAAAVGDVHASWDCSAGVRTPCPRTSRLRPPPRPVWAPALRYNVRG